MKGSAAMMEPGGIRARKKIDTNRQHESDHEIGPRSSKAKEHGIIIHKGVKQNRPVGSSNGVSAKRA